MSGATPRLAALARLYPRTATCGTCRDWPRVRFVATHDEANVVAPPSTCPDCGRRPTRLTRIIVVGPEDDTPKAAQA